MKLPKCPHCEKLMVGIIPHGALVDLKFGSACQRFLIYICPESMKPLDPIWVEVLEA